MTYQADHLAWQQRVNQEFKAQSSTQESAKFVEQGQWLNYPDLVDYLKTQQNVNNGGISKQARAFGQQYTVGGSGSLQGLADQGMVSRKDILTNSRQRQRSQRSGIYDDTGSQYSYSGKSKILYQRGGSKRSTSQAKKNTFTQIGPYTGQNDDTKSRLSKQNVSRFNEVLDQPMERGPKSFVSQARSNISKAASQKPSVFSKQSYLKKKQEIQQKEADIDNVEPVISAEQQEAMEQQIMEEMEALDQMGEQPAVLESASQIQPTQSQMSKMSGKTYISQLHKQLEEEKVAREQLEYELHDLKKVSEEINSHLSSLKKQQNQ